MQPGKQLWRMRSLERRIFLRYLFLFFYWRCFGSGEGGLPRSFFLIQLGESLVEPCRFRTSARCGAAASPLVGTAVASNFLHRAIGEYGCVVVVNVEAFYDSFVVLLNK